MIKTVKYNINHTAGFEYSGSEISTIEGDNTIEQIINLASNGISYTIFEDDIVIGFVGMNMIDNDTGEIWAVLNKEISVKLVSVIKALRVLLKNETKKAGVKRLMIYCVADNKKTTRFAEFFGFEKKLDFSLYAKDMESK